MHIKLFFIVEIEQALYYGVEFPSPCRSLYNRTFIEGKNIIKKIMVDLKKIKMCTSEIAKVHI